MKEKLLFYIRRMTLIRDTRAGAAIEFALVFPIFFFFLLGFIEFGLIMFGNAVIDSVMTRASRKAMVGCIERDCVNNGWETYDTIREEIVLNSIGFVDPTATNSDGSARFRVAIFPLEDYAGTVPWGTTDLGESGQPVVYMLEYDWSLFLPVPEEVIGFNEEFFTFTFATVVRNERWDY